MCVLVSTESMHSALCSSMKPMPPMSAARLNTIARPCSGLAARLEQLKVELTAVDPVEALVPLVQRLDVDRPDVAEPLAHQVGDQVAADEAAAPAHQQRSGPVEHITQHATVSSSRV